MSEAKIPYKIYLSEEEMPRAWYNVRADMKVKPAPLLDPATGKPMGFEDLRGVFCDELIRQELDDETRSGIFFRFFGSGWFSDCLAYSALAVITLSCSSIRAICSGPLPSMVKSKMRLTTGAASSSIIQWSLSAGSVR